MNTYKFITIEQGKPICHCITNNENEFFEFIRYVLVDLKKPEEFYIKDVDFGVTYTFKDLAKIAKDIKEKL